MNSKFIKFFSDPKNWLTIIGGTISACAVYFGIIARIDHLESKIDVYIAGKEEKIKFIDYEISEIKVKNSNQDDDLKDFKKQLFQISAILPKELKLETK